MIDLSPPQNPKSRHPLSAPSGENLPKITAAIAMKPCPTITVGLNWLTVASVTKAPPRPARKPDKITQIYLTRYTFIPSDSQASGCSPTALRCAPNLVL